MRSGSRIRPARPAEADHLTGLAMRSKAHWGYSEDFIVACREELAVSAADIADLACACYVCEVGGSIAGYFMVAPVSGDVWELEALFVEPVYIGQGIGRRLLYRARTEAAGRGAGRMLIQGDPHAEAFYRAAGAVRVGERASESIPGRLLPLFEIELALPGQNRASAEPGSDPALKTGV